MSFFCRYPLLFALLSLPVLAHTQSGFNAVDRAALQVRLASGATIAELAQALTRTQRSETDKVRAIYTWITHNIAYNDTIVSKNWLGKPENAEKQRAENVLRSRSAVCEGYANLFEALCTEAGIRCSFVSGDVKDEFGNVPDIGHAWNAVFVDGEWRLCDPTWGSGYNDPATGAFRQQFNERFFLADPAEFLVDHFPDDPAWQCSENPLTALQFRSAGAAEIAESFRQTPEKPFSFRDTIDAWFQLDSIERMLSASRRIIRFNPGNDYALYRLGMYFYNMGYRQYYDVSDAFIETMYEQGDFLDDSTYMWTQIEQAERNQTRSWDYLRYVQDSQVKSFVNELPRPEQQAGSFEYLRGMYHLWLVHHLGDQLPQNAERPAKRPIQTIQYHGRAGMRHFDKALLSLDGRDKMLWSVWYNNKSLLHYELAHHNNNYYARWEDLGDKELRENMAGLDQVENDLQEMKSAMETALQKGARMKGAFVLDEYPELMAQLYSDRGAVSTAIQRYKFRSDIAQPTQITLQKAVAMLEGFEPCNEFFQKALSLTDKAPAGERTAELKKNIYSQQIYLFSLMGDLQLNGAQNTHNSAQTMEEIKALLPSIRTATDKARKYYVQASALLGKSGATPQLNRQITERVQNARELEEFLKKNYGN